MYNKIDHNSNRISFELIIIWINDFVIIIIFDVCTMTTKTIKTILFASLMVAMILPFSAMNFADAAPEDRANDRTNNKTPPESMRVLQDFEFEGIVPEQINTNTLNNLEIGIVKNPQVKGLLGNDYEYRGHMQRQTENDGWQPILSYYTDNKKYTVTVVMDKGKVVSVEKYENVKWSHLRAFAIDEYDDDRYTITGLSMKAEVPDYTHKSGTAFTAILLNAQKANSNDADTCTSSAAPNSYWAQMGMQFDSDGVRLGLTDTFLDCEPMYFPISFSTGDAILYWIYIDDATDVWTLLIWNQTQGGSAYAYTVEVADSYNLSVDTYQTSVWFENAHYTSNGWDADFTSDPVVDYAAFKYIDGNYYYWFGEYQHPLYCESGTTAADIMSGTFEGLPHDVTFDVSEIANKCDA